MRALRPGNQARLSISWAPTKSGSSTPAPTSKPDECCSGESVRSHPVSVGWSCRGDKSRRRWQRILRLAGRESTCVPTRGSGPTTDSRLSEPKTRDGWDPWGPRFYFDADGFLYLSDRTVDMFTVGGRNVYPAGKFESALSAHTDIVSFLVSRAPTTTWARCPMRWCSRRRCAARRGLFRKFFADQVPATRWPKTVEIVENRTAADEAGKARRFVSSDEIIRFVGRRIAR